MYEIFDELIKQKGLSAYKVAKDTGISQTTLSDWKRGRSVPKTDKLQKLADYLGVTLNYLLGNGQKEKAPSHFEREPDDITFDDFSYAMHHESGNLSETDKEILLNLAKDMAKHRIEKDKREEK